jgi:hypothetical protein
VAGEKLKDWHTDMLKWDGQGRGADLRLEIGDFKPLREAVRGVAEIGQEVCELFFAC